VAKWVKYATPSFVIVLAIGISVWIAKHP